MKLIKLFLTVIVSISFFSIGYASKYEKGKTYFGFKLLEMRFVKEVDAECLYFEHIKSGARLFKIASKDDNKTFSISFKTDPESDCGTPHILEHSVLNGSKKFPVKSPYDILRKGSLLTFINAFTGDDLTSYPIASRNDKDYFNLMNVYLDAVFQPMLLQDDRILKQEGWHYELDKPDGETIYKGVVYNEMKGAFSSATRELDFQAAKQLFPDNGYQFTAGGYPTAIPKLTNEAFMNYHKKYYHPVNSHIVLYGNGNTEKELQFLDKEYLSKYNLAERPKSFQIQRPFNQMKTVHKYYSVNSDSKTKDQTYLGLYFVVGLNTDRALVMGLNALCDVLVNQEAAPIRIALQEAGIGQDISASVDEKMQNVLQIVVQNANPEDKDRFKEIVLTKFKEAIEKGVDKKALEGSLNREEFNLREGNDAQKGLNYTFQVLPGWFFADDPFLTLEYEKPLAKVKTSLTTNFLEQIIEKQIVNNPHSLLIVLEPKPGLEKENSQSISEELKSFTESLSNEAKAKLVKETSELKEYQLTEDTPEALATIPLLTKKDINPKAEWYQFKEKRINNVPVINYEEFCNNVVYTKLLFDERVLPQELIPYAALLTEVLGNQNTKNFTFGEIDNQLNIHTGGFNSSMTSYFEKSDNELLIPKFSVNSKSMNTKVDKMFELTMEILLNTKFSDTERLKAILTRYQARLEARVKQNGYGFASTRITSYFSKAGMLNELTTGISYYRFITNLLKNFDTKSDEIIKNLEETAFLLFNKKNLTASVTCANKDLVTFAEIFGKFVNFLPENKVEFKNWNFEYQKKNEGFLTASKVQYVMKGYNFQKLGFKWNGKMNVLSQILATDWLQNRVRVIGGAYGGFSSIYQNGLFLFSSYRDPNLKETFDNYDAIPDYLSNLSIDDKQMTRYIIGTIAEMDVPMTTQQKGNESLKNYFEKTTLNQIQSIRDAVISTTLQDIKEMKGLVKAVLDQNTFCVYGNEEKVKSNKELFKAIEKLD